MNELLIDKVERTTTSGVNTIFLALKLKDKIDKEKGNQRRRQIVIGIFPGNDDLSNRVIIRMSKKCPGKFYIFGWQPALVTDTYIELLTLQAWQSKIWVSS